MKRTSTELSGGVTVAVTVWLLPTVFVSLTGLSEMPVTLLATPQILSTLSFGSPSSMSPSPSTSIQAMRLSVPAPPSPV